MCNYGGICLISVVLICVIPCVFAECGHGYDKYYSTDGDVYIIGLFNAHRDANCTIPNAIVLQQMYNIAITVKMLNDIDYVPGVTIGMSLYDTCNNKDTAKKSLMTSLVDMNCKIPYNLGIFSSKQVFQTINNISSTLDLPVYVLNYSPNLNILIKISVELLIELKYKSIDLAVFPNFDLIQHFNALTVEENICVKKTSTFAQYNGSCPGNNMVIIIAVTSSELSPLLKLEMDCMSTFVVIILDNNVDLSSLTEHLLLHEAYIIISSNIWPEFTISIEDDFQTVVTNIEENLRHSNVTMDFIRTASALISVVDRMKEKLKKDCGLKQDDIYSVCKNASRFHKVDERVVASQNENYYITNTSNIGGRVTEILGIKQTSILQYLILKSEFNVVNNYGEIRIVENDVHIEFANPIFPSVGNFDCGDTNFKNCQNCSNFVNNKNEENITHSSSLEEENEIISWSFRSDGWAFSLITVCIIGILTGCCVCIFLIIRLMNGDILEGNPSSTFLLIVASIFMYISVFPFCIQKRENTDENGDGGKVVCVLKLFGSSISYCFIYSIILSRAFMILSSDYNGSFMSHINGYLQMVLCVFMFAVQFGLVLEFWFFSWVLSDVNYCSKMTPNSFLLYMTYNGVLLLFTSFVAPFVRKSRRNYKEGVSFVVLTILFVLIWFLWSFGYYFSENASRKDFFAAFGMTATATCVLLCVLIPRTYFIITSMVRDQVTTAIPSNVSNLIDMNYRSTQALYDSVRIDATAIKSRGRLNAGFYEEPRAPSSGPDARNRPVDDVIYCIDRKGKSAEESVRSSEINIDYEETDSLQRVGQRITKF